MNSELIGGQWASCSQQANIRETKPVSVGASLIRDSFECKEWHLPIHILLDLSDFILKVPSDFFFQIRSRYNHW